MKVLFLPFRITSDKDIKYYIGTHIKGSNIFLVAAKVIKVVVVVVMMVTYLEYRYSTHI